ncbi:MAG TPA: amidase, partial [Gammaproteobacteria bacterium]|nr:amidase [Gammaproteobacteria bacterium]
MENVYARIAAFNPELNAIVSLMPKAEALQQAALADATPTAERGPLHGLPMAIKDVVDVAGLTTTSGFVPFANRVPKHDAKLVKRLRAAGAIIIGHTNVPEFALGSQTFNSLFGVTKNPYDLSKTPGGSSGG